MPSFRMVIFSFAFITVALPTHAADAPCEQVLRINFNALRSLGTEGYLVFPEQPLTVRVSFGSFFVGSGQPSDCVIEFPQAWWSGLRWELSAGDDREATIVTPKLIRDFSTTPERVGGPHPSEAVFELLPLPLGDYRLRVTGSGNSAQQRFSVRRGDEDVATRRVYLRYALRTSRGQVSPHQILQELSTLEPDNPQHHESLGNLALGSGRLAEAAHHFDLVIAIYNRNLMKWRASHPDEGTGEFDAAISLLSRVRDAAIRFGTERQAVKVEIESLGDRRRYTFSDPDTNRTLAVIR